MSATGTHEPVRPADAARTREGEARKEPILFAAALTAAFGALALAGVFRHEMWRDEVQAWMIARDSASPIDLLRNMRHETHPALWHASLWLLTRATTNLRAFQIFHVALASAGVFLLARFAPFRRFEKALLAIGYFSLYEYGVIARNYVMGIVLVYAFCAVFPRRRFLILGSILFLLTQTTLHGVIVACGLALALAAEAAAVSRRRGVTFPARARTALALVGVGAALAALQMSRAFHPHLSVARGSLGVGHVLDVLGGIARSSVPIQAIGARPLWNSDLLAEVLARLAGAGAAGWILAAASLGLGAAAVVRLRRRPHAMLFYVATSLALLFFSYAMFQGGMRHQGHLFVALVAAFWLAGSRELCGARPSAAEAAHAAGVRATARDTAPRWFTALLVVQAAAGLFAWQADLRRPFSEAPAAARFIRRERLDALPIFGDRAPPASSLQPYLPEPIVYLADGKRGGFIDYGEAMAGKVADPPRRWANLLRETLGEPAGHAILVLNYPVEVVPRRYAAREVARFTGSLVGDEDYYLYAVTWPAVAAANSSTNLLEMDDPHGARLLGGP